MLASLATVGDAPCHPQTVMQSYWVAETQKLLGTFCGWWNPSRHGCDGNLQLRKSRCQTCLNSSFLKDSPWALCQKLSIKSVTLPRSLKSWTYKGQCIVHD